MSSHPGLPEGFELHWRDATVVPHGILPAGWWWTQSVNPNIADKCGVFLSQQDAIANAKICDFADKINMRKDGSEMVTWTKVDGVILVITQAQSPQITHTPYVLCSSCRLSDRDTEEMDMWCNNTLGDRWFRGPSHYYYGFREESDMAMFMLAFSGYKS